MEKKTHALSNQDTWFHNSLLGIIGGEVALVKRGTRPELDREAILNWVARHAVTPSLPYKDEDKQEERGGECHCLKVAAPDRHSCPHFNHENKCLLVHPELRSSIKSVTPQPIIERGGKTLEECKNDIKPWARDFLQSELKMSRLQSETLYSGYIDACIKFAELFVAQSKQERWLPVD